MENRKIAWTKTSLRQFENAIAYIALDSEQNAIKVMNDIIAALSKTLRHSEFYRPDKYKRNNDGSYRAFEKHHYRVSYRVTKKEIRVLRVRHTSMEPKEY
jgi:plasmid stabilization system protein ParE